MDWMKALKVSINYIEEHLTEDITPEDVCQQVYVSNFYFQKGFKIITGYSIGEYIRNRRLYMSALDLVSTDMKVLDLALKYGYETHESFTKAFSRFHNHSPRQIRNHSDLIKPFLPLTITLQVKGGHKMDYSIVKKDKFQVLGFKNNYTYDNAYSEIPKSWDVFSKGFSENRYDASTLKVIETSHIGEFGVCIDEDPSSGNFDYMIAGTYNGGDIPDNMLVYDIPESEWAIFKCIGPMPGALQTVNTYIFKEWLPGNPDYDIAMGINIEWYSMGDITSESYESEIWISVKAK